MIKKNTFQAKKVFLWCIVIVGSLITVCLSVVCIISVRIGFTHMHQSSFWVPIMAGMAVFGAILWLYLRLMRAALGSLQDEE